MQMMKIVCAALLLAIGAGTAFGQSVSSKGTATVTYKSRYTPAVRVEALEKAKINALERYFAETGQAKSKNYDVVRGQMTASIDTYLLDTVVLSEDLDKDNRSYTLTVRVDLNKSKIENALLAASATESTPDAQKSLMTFVFMARQRDTVRSFDDRVYTRSDANVEGSSGARGERRTEESERIRKSSVKTVDKDEVSHEYHANSSVSTESGGSTLQRAAETQWTVNSVEEVNNAVSGVFSDAGYKVVDADYLETNGKFDVDAIRRDYGTGSDLSAATKRSMMAGIRAAGIPYLALATLDKGIRDRDPATGLTRIYVTVNGKVLDVRGAQPVLLSAISPAQFAGMGPDESVAYTNALKLAADNAAQQLLNALNARGVR